jgi:hypothetical protein
MSAQSLEFEQSFKDRAIQADLMDLGMYQFSKKCKRLHKSKSPQPSAESLNKQQVALISFRAEFKRK